MAFVVPCLSIVVCYARIFYIVRKTAMRSHEPSTPMTTTGGSLHIHQKTMSTKPLPTQQSHQQQNKNNNKTADDSEKHLLQHQTTNTKIDNKQQFEIDTNSENSSSISYNIHPHPMRGPKIFLKFIDSSIDSDLPPSLSGLRINSCSGGGGADMKLLSAKDRNLSSVSISKNVEFFDDTRCTEEGSDAEAEEDDDDVSSMRDSSTRNGGNGERRELRSSMKKKRKRNDPATHEVDSAVEESTSSSENNQVF